MRDGVIHASGQQRGNCDQAISLVACREYRLLRRSTIDEAMSVDDEFFARLHSMQFGKRQARGLHVANAGVQLRAFVARIAERVQRKVPSFKEELSHE